MDLDALVNQQLVQNMSQQKKANKALFPQQQQQRSYSNSKPVPQKLNLNTVPYLIDEYHGEWMMWYTLEWPGMAMPTDQRNCTQKQLVEFAKEWIKLRSYQGGEKYYKLKFIDKKKMQFIFDADLWIKDAVGTVRQQYVAPLSLTYRSRKKLPDQVYIASSGIAFNKFISERFKMYLRTKSSKLKHAEFQFIKKFTNDLFTYNYSFRDNKFKATLKFSVVMASMAAYMIWKHQKSLSKSEVKTLQKKASNMKDIKRLDKYLKKL